MDFWLWFAIFVFLGLGSLIDVASGVSFYKGKELPSRKDIAQHYIANGLFGIFVAVLFLIALFKV
jgi:hypothetical protein